jgi:hypothetical protein
MQTHSPTDDARILGPLPLPRSDWHRTGTLLLNRGHFHRKAALFASPSLRRSDPYELRDGLVREGVFAEGQEGDEFYWLLFRALRADRRGG